MTTTTLQQLTVLGAGVLGGQIAWHSAFKGKHVVCYDINPTSIQQCQQAHTTYATIYQQTFNLSEVQTEQIHQRIQFSDQLAPAVAQADIIIESIAEEVTLKQQCYRRIAKLVSRHTIIASNSSTFLPSQFCQLLPYPEQFAALHFANIIWASNIAEVMAHSTSSNATLSALTQFAIEIGMVPIPLQKQHSGYICNSLLIPLLNAAQTLITQGVSSAKNIDKTYMILNRGCGTGPCGMMDIIGFNTVHKIFKQQGQANKDSKMLANADYIEQHFLQQKIYGLASGQGYYQYPQPSYQADTFLAQPDLSAIPSLVAQINAT
jgi:3-hydroxyacyl-CoA dehydrogenase